MLYEEELNENIEAVSDVWKLLLEMYQRLPFRVFFWKRIIRVIDIGKRVGGLLGLTGKKKRTYACQECRFVMDYQN